ncbi:MAG: TerB family tellurite resistance protein [Rhodospirillales bacterium]
MIGKIKSLLFDQAAAETADEDTNADGSLTAALLIQAALADGTFSDEERDVIRGILVRDHGADKAEAAELMNDVEARVRDSAQMFGFTSAVNRNFSFEQKIGLMETLWEVVLADGIIDSHESTLMRRLAGLLHVPDRDSAVARQRVQARLTGQ